MDFTARAPGRGNWPPHPTETELVQAVPVDSGADRVLVHLQMGFRRLARRRVRGCGSGYFVTFLM